MPRLEPVNLAVLAKRFQKNSGSGGFEIEADAAA
jgi:hypothetical protein